MENTTTNFILGFNDWREEYLKYIDVSDNTIGTYDVGLKKFASFLIATKVSEPTRDDVIAFRDILLLEGNKVSTINTYLIAIRTFFKFLQFNGLYKNITENVKSLKDTELHKRNSLTIEQCQKVLGGAQDLREKALFYLTLSCGLRANEIVNIQLDDFKFEQGQQRLYILGKGRDDKTDFVIVPQEVMDVINDYVKLYGIVDYLFVSMSTNNFGGKLTTRSIERIMNEMYERAGVKTEKITFHSLRHTFGTTAITSGEDIREVSKAMRHKSVVTTERYLHDLEMQNNTCSASVFKNIMGGM